MHVLYKLFLGNLATKNLVTKFPEKRHREMKAALSVVVNLALLILVAALIATAIDTNSVVAGVAALAAIACWATVWILILIRH